MALLDESILKSIAEDTLSASDGDTLAGLDFLVPDAGKEKEEMFSLFDEANKRLNRLQATVVMNLDCNLACRYCYQDTIKGRHYLTPGIADLLIDFTEKNYLSAGKDIYFDFYGGEPLLSFEAIKHISKRLKARAEERGLSYAFNLVTNGTLLSRERAEELAALGLRGVKVTIDGPKENHDRFRPFKSGSGSFDLIIKNMKAIDHPVGIQLGGNFTQQNYRTFPSLLDFFLREGITPERVALVKFDPVTAPKGKGLLRGCTEGCASINEPWLFEASLFLREEILKRGFPTSRIRPTLCMVELSDQMVVNCDGILYKCPALVGCKGFEAGDLRTGIRDYRNSYHLGFWKNQECLDCPYLPLCFGGCRHLKLIRDGKIDDVDCRKPYLEATLESFLKQEITYLKNG